MTSTINLKINKIEKMYSLTFSTCAFYDYWNSKLINNFISKLQFMESRFIKAFALNINIDLESNGWVYYINCSNLKDSITSDGF